MAQLLIYRASAGSGKTHILVTRYIQWALRYPAAFKHILAVTFTNGATQEMKERIIAYLYSLSIGEASVLQKTLVQAGWEPLPLQARSKEVLSMMLHQYGDFAVTTIDGFFHKIVQSFTKELGLKRNFSIEMDEALALKETIEALLTLDEPQKWIVDLALTKLLAGKSWQVKSDIQALGKAVFEESFKLHEKALLTAFQQEDSWSHFLATIQKHLRSFEKKMQKIGQTALHLLQQAALEPEDFAYGSKGVIGYFLKLASKKDFQPTKRAIIASKELKHWQHKKATNKSREIATLLQPLLVEAIDCYVEEGLSYRTAVAASRFTHFFCIIRALLIGLEQYRSKHNLLFISDIATLLYQIIQENDTPLLYEKIGNQFHHFLIDEFQDLSLFQWTNIKPLLRNSLAQGYTNLLVGDVKQSIYRWRGSDWKLLNHQVEQEFTESRMRYLTTNRRSQAAIVWFNNNFFKAASHQLVDYLESELDASDQPIAPLQDGLAQMRRAYSDVTQQAIAGTKGYVELFFLRSDPIDPSGDLLSWKTVAQKEVITWVDQLQKEGIQARDIVLLVRNNSEAALITSLFNNNRPTGHYGVRSDHSAALSSHIAIKVLIHALYYLNDVDDWINTVAWVAAYLSCMEKPPAIWHHYRLGRTGAGENPIEALFPQSFWLQKDFLKNLSIYRCVDLLIALLFEKGHNYADILSFFQSIILNFCDKEADTIAAFLVWWEKRGKNIKLPDSHDENAMRVMTIHQSKGLACKVVIIPFCSWHLDHPPQNGPTLWRLPHQTVPYFPIWPLAYGVDLKETYYAKDYYLERMQVHLDNLNLLYVAFTRAEERLYIMAPLPETMEKMATTSDLIYQSVVTEKINDANRGQLAIQETAIGTKFCFR